MLRFVLVGLCVFLTPAKLAPDESWIRCATEDSIMFGP